MQGHLPVPPQPHFPAGLSPVIGYIATRERQPLEERTPEPRQWWEIDDEEEEWPRARRPFMKATAVVVTFSLIVAGLGTLLDVILSGH